MHTEDAPHGPQASKNLSQAVERDVPRSSVYARSSEGPLREGEILSNLIQAHLNLNNLKPTEELTVDFKTHPFAVILTQDCDVVQDYAIRQTNGTPEKTLPNVLFCEVISADELHVAVKKGGLGHREWRALRENKLERYQFLESVPADLDALEAGLPGLGIDFKRYFTIPTAEVYARIESREADRRCRLVGPYVQHLRARFFNYQSRIALPAEHKTE